MFLFFSVPVSLLARNVFLISFPACMGCHTLSSILLSFIIPTFTAVILPSLGVGFTNTEKGESHWCQCKLLWEEEESLLLLCSNQLPPHLNLENNLGVLGRHLTSQCDNSPVWRELRVFLCE